MGGRHRRHDVRLPRTIKCYARRRASGKRIGRNGPPSHRAAAACIAQHQGNSGARRGLRAPRYIVFLVINSSTKACKRSPSDKGAMVWGALLLLGALGVGAQRDCYGSVVSDLRLLHDRRSCRSPRPGAPACSVGRGCRPLERLHTRGCRVRIPRALRPRPERHPQQPLSPNGERHSALASFLSRLHCCLRLLHQRHLALCLSTDGQPVECLWGQGGGGSRGGRRRAGHAWQLQLHGQGLGAAAGGLWRHAAVQQRGG